MPGFCSTINECRILISMYALLLATCFLLPDCEAGCQHNTIGILQPLSPTDRNKVFSPLPSSESFGARSRGIVASDINNYVPKIPLILQQLWTNTYLSRVLAPRRFLPANRL